MHYKIYIVGKTGAELAQVFADIPAWVTTLDLSGNGLGNYTGAQLVQVFTAIPTGVTALYLGFNQLSNKTGAELAQAFAAIPAGVTTLDFSSNELGTGAQLVQAFTAIPTGVTTLDLGFNLLSNKTGAELAQAFAAIPAGVTTLNLSVNYFSFKTGTELAQAFAAIPTGVTKLDLTGNGLGDKTGAELAQAFSAIPAGVTTLDLRGNYFSFKTGTELAQTFAAIPTGVTSLDLTRNGLGNKTGAELAQAFAAIPTGVTSLDLSNNGLGYKTGGELAQILSTIPQHVTHINLQNNELFSGKTLDQQEALLKQLASCNPNGSRFDFSQNGGMATLLRTLPLLMDIRHNKLGPDEFNLMCSYLTSHSLRERPLPPRANYTFFEEPTVSTLSERFNNTLSLIQNTHEPLTQKLNKVHHEVITKVKDHSLSLKQGMHIAQQCQTLIQALADNSCTQKHIDEFNNQTQEFQQHHTLYKAVLGLSVAIALLISATIGFVCAGLVGAAAGAALGLSISSASAAFFAPKKDSLLDVAQESVLLAAPKK